MQVAYPGTVLAHIFSAVLRRHTNAAPTELPCIESLYVACPAPFREVNEFIAHASSAETGYHLDLYTVSGPMKEALARYLSGSPGEPLGPGSGAARAHSEAPSSARRSVQAIFLGVRTNDPHGSTLSVRSPCDPGWPPLLRVHPILDWSYTDVWAFLRCPALGTPAARYPPCIGGGGTHGVPYCVLYDQGFTSLGSMHNTCPNPCLAQDHGAAPYRPAYMLADATQERAGRR